MNGRAVVKIIELIGSSLNRWEEAAGNATSRQNYQRFAKIWISGNANATTQYTDTWTTISINSSTSDASCSSPQVKT